MINRFRNLPWLVYGPIWLGPFVLLAPAWLTGRAIFWGTPILQFAPWMYYASQTLASGHLPLWNPLLGMGAPLLANYQSALFYPPNWLLLALAALGGAPLLAWGQALLIALHLAWAGTGLAKLAGRLGLGRLAQAVAGLAFGMCGYLVARAGFLSINAAAAWLPWILLGVLELSGKPNLPQDPAAKEGQVGVYRKPAGSFLLLTLALGMQLLAGHAQTTWYSLLLAGMWAIFLGVTSRKIRPLTLLALAGLFAAALSAIQILPTAEYLLQSQRESGLEIDFALQYSFSPWHFLTLALPDFFGNPGRGNYGGYANYWESAVYIGLLPFLLATRALALALRSRNNRPASNVSAPYPVQVQSWPPGIPGRAVPLFLGLVTVLSFALALGKNTPLFPWLYRHVPTFDMFVGPARITLWAEFALALLAGYGIQAWRRPRGRALYWTRLGTAGAFAAIGGALLALRISDRVDPAQVAAVAQAGVWAGGAGLLSLLAPRTGQDCRPRWAWAVVLLIAADLLAAHVLLNPAASLELYQAPSPQAARIENLSGGERLFLNAEDEYAIKFERFFLFETFDPREDWLNLRQAPLPNTTLLDGLPSANNFDPLVPARYHRWMKFLAGADPAAQDRLLPRMGVGLVERAEASQPGGVSFTQVQSLGRARWVPCAVPVETPEEAWQKVNAESSTPDFARVFVVLEGLPGTQTPGCNSQDTAKVQMVAENPNLLEVRVISPSHGWIVIADPYYPGWTAQVDGKSTSLLRADYLFRAVVVPEGEHQVIFQYHPLSFRLGALISLFAWGVFLFLIREYRIKWSKRSIDVSVS